MIAYLKQLYGTDIGPHDDGGEVMIQGSLGVLACAKVRGHGTGDDARQTEVLLQDAIGDATVLPSVRVNSTQGGHHGSRGSVLTHAHLTKMGRKF